MPAKKAKLPIVAEDTFALTGKSAALLSATEVGLGGLLHSRPFGARAELVKPKK